MNAQVIKKIRKTLAYGITATLFLIISAFLILQMPPVQNAIVERLLKNFSNVSGFQSNIQSFRLLWFDRLELEGVSIMDPANNEMIGVKKILINFKLIQLFEQKDIHVDGIILDSAKVFLTKIVESDSSHDLNFNVLIRRINQQFSSGAKRGNPPKIHIGEAVLNQCQFFYIDQYRDTIPRGFDYNHFALTIDEGQLKNFKVIGDTTEFDVTTLLIEDQKTKFKIRQLSTFFRISQASMEFTNLNLHAGQSTVSDTIIFTYNGQRDLHDFVNKVKIYAHLNNTIIYPEDLALFVPGAETIRKPITVNGLMKGRINKFKVSDMQAAMGNSRLLGSLDMDGLPDINETFIILNLTNSQLDFNDLDFVLKEKVLDRLIPFGRLTLNGQFLGYPTDFVANGDFIGALGRIKSDINFKVNEQDFDKSSYTGKLTMLNFKLGQYLKDTSNFQNVSLDGRLTGAGLTLETANFKLDGKVNQLGIRGYTYSNIITNAQFASQFFSGFLKINDPNLEFTAQGSVDLRQGKNLLKMQATLDTALLHNLNLSTKKIFLQSKFDIDLKGLKLDSIIGTAYFRDLKIMYEDQWLALNNIRLYSDKLGDNRVVDLESSLINANIHGNFTFTDLTADIQTLLNEISLNIKNDKLEILSYYTTKTKRPTAYQTEFTLTLKDIKPISDLLNTDLFVASNSTIQGNFSSGYTSIFRAFTTLDSLFYKGNLWLNTEAELTASKISDSTSVLAMAFINSGQQYFSSGLKTEKLVAEGIWNRNHIDFNIDCDQQVQNNYIRMQGAVDFLRDSTLIKFLPSTIHLLEREWLIEPNNLITVSGSNWNFKNIQFTNSNQSIWLYGSLSKDPSKELQLKINDLDIAILNVLTDKKFSGTMNADITLADFYNQPFIQNDIHIDSLVINDFLVGNITGKNEWDNSNKRFNINCFIDKENVRIVNILGQYKPSTADPLEVIARLENAPLKLLEPFLKDIFGHLDGSLTGACKITGTLNHPRIHGDGIINNGQLTVSYLQTSYWFNGSIELTPDAIVFSSIEVMDSYRNRGTLTGSIGHDNFKKMHIDLNANFRNMQMLNTIAKDNSLFFGQAFATGDVHFYGPIHNLKITSTARTEKNTRIYIPVSGTSTVERKDFINFISFRDSTSTEQEKNKKKDNKIDLTGVTLDFNLDVTPDAHCEIIFDIKSGDIIRGRGNGDLKLQLDTKGEFNMFGQIDFTEGGYNFTLYDIINKEFEIQRGSRITWYGDPYGALLNITASYNQLASLGPIVLTSNPELANAPEIRRKYPVQVVLKLDGPMLSPQINFDIIANDLPQTIYAGESMVRLDFMFQAFKNKMDEQELKKQVFSLIVLRKFSPPDAFNTSGSLYNSVSELLSNQLSYWMSQVDENLEINVDLGTMDEAAFNTFQLRLSYTFLNGRLRITRDGTIGNTDYNNPTDNRGSLASIAGDWTVDYYLTADGKFKVKMYNRTSYNQLSTSLNNQNNFTTGVSLQHVQSFNEIKDLLKFSRNKNKHSEKKDPELNEDAIKEEDEKGGQ